MKAVLADDEPELLNYLKCLLNKLWPELDICGTALNGRDALSLITHHRPDIAFLDIRMPTLSGLEVAAQVIQQCQIIFVTAYDEYAVEAFEKNAIDYLLKPYTSDRLVKTITRLKSTQKESLPTANIEPVLTAIKIIQKNYEEKLTWIRASASDDTFMIHVDDVLYFESDTKYTNVVTIDRSYLIRMTLSELDSQLDNKSFWRIHRGTIINLHYVDSVKRLTDGRYLLYIKGSNQELTVSRSYAQKFKQM